MRKITFLLVFLMATMFYACSSDDENSLEGTTWVSETEYELRTLVFGKTTATYTYIYDDDGDGIFEPSEIEEEYAATYTIDGNNIVANDGTNTVTGIVSGNKLVLGSGEYSITYYKQ